MTNIPSKTHSISKNSKNLGYITYFNYDKNGYYTSSYIKSRKDPNTLND